MYKLFLLVGVVLLFCGAASAQGCTCTDYTERQFNCYDDAHQFCGTQVKSFCQGFHGCQRCFTLGFGLCCSTEYTTASLCGQCPLQCSAKPIGPKIRERLLIANACRGTYAFLLPEKGLVAHAL